MRAVPISNALGAELVEFDIRRPCDMPEQAELRQLFCQYHLLLVRGQDVTERDQDRFVGYFGPIHLWADGRRETYVSNREDEIVGPGLGPIMWHSDGTFGPRPGIATSLWAVEVAPEVVPTTFANAVRVLDHLPPDLRARIEALQALHLRDTQTKRTNRQWCLEELPPDPEPGRFFSAEQPIVYPLPHTDQKTLMVNELLTSHVIGMPRQESEALLEELFAHLYAPDNVYTHQWQTDDVIIWDNLALNHCRPAELGSPARHLRRLSLDGFYTAAGLLDWRETNSGGFAIPGPKQVGV
jgi:taurine dioxygenase